MRVEVEHSWANRGIDKTDIRHWTYDITHRRDGDRCEWFGRCQFKGELDGREYSLNEQFNQVVGDDSVLSYSKPDSEEEPGHAMLGSNVKKDLFLL